MKKKWGDNTMKKFDSEMLGNTIQGKWGLKGLALSRF